MTEPHTEQNCQRASRLEKDITRVLGSVDILCVEVRGLVSLLAKVEVRQTHTDRELERLSRVLEDVALLKQASATQTATLSNLTKQYEEAKRFQYELAGALTFISVCSPWVVKLFF